MSDLDFGFALIYQCDPNFRDLLILTALSKSNNPISKKQLAQTSILYILFDRGLSDKDLLKLDLQRLIDKGAIVACTEDTYKISDTYMAKDIIKTLQKKT